METIDQLALLLSLGATCALAVLALAWYLWRLIGRRDSPADCVGGFFHYTIVGSLLSGSVLLALLVWLVGVLDLRAYHHHYAYFVWFIAFIANAIVGVVLAFIGGLLLERIAPPNQTVEPDARKSGARGSL